MVPIKQRIGSEKRFILFSIGHFFPVHICKVEYKLLNYGGNSETCCVFLQVLVRRMEAMATNTEIEM
jgi:hypothetical protein